MTKVPQRFTWPSASFVLVISLWLAAWPLAAIASPQAPAGDSRAKVSAQDVGRPGSQPPSRNLPRSANVYVRIPASFIADSMSQAINKQRNGIHDNILGTSVCSNTHTHGQSLVSLESSDAMAIFQVDAHGQIHVDSVGQNRGVVTYSDGEGTFSSTSQLSIDQLGMKSTQPEVSLHMQTTIRSICARLALKRRLATRRIVRSKSQADAIGRQLAKRRMVNEFSRESDDAVHSFNQEFEKLIGWLNTELQTSRDQLSFSSRNDYLLATLNVGQEDVTPNHLLATWPNQAPLLSIHQSVFSQFETELAGTQFSSDDAQRASVDNSWMATWIKSVRPVDPVHESEQKQLGWTIEFAPSHPLAVELEDDLITIKLRTVRFQVAEEIQQRTWSFVISLRPQVLSSGGIRFVVDDWDVIPTRVESGGRISASEQVIRQRFQSQLADIIRDFEIPELNLPENEILGTGTIQLQQFNLLNGWLTLQFMPTEKLTVEAPIDPRHDNR